MTEHFQNIEDETFPSFLVESLISNNGDILENVTISSNLGIPVAASTVAKERTISDARLPNVQASYLEDVRLSLVAGSTHNSLLDCDSKGRFASSFKDDLQDTHKFIGAQVADSLHKSHLKEIKVSHDAPKNNDAYCLCHSQDASLGILPLEHMQDLSIGLCTLSLKEEENQGNDQLSESDLFEDADYALCDHLNRSLSSFLENEKLLSESLNASFTDDDLDDDELYDEMLESYFKQLAPPEMQPGDIEGEELPAANNSLLSCHGSIQVDGSNRPSFRPGLEGDSSEEEHSEMQTVASDDELACRRSAEGEIINANIPVNGGGKGDGSSGSEGDGSADQLNAVPVFSTQLAFDSWASRVLERDVAGEENQDNAEIPQVEDGVDPVGNSNKIDLNFRSSSSSEMVLDCQQPLVFSFSPEEFHSSGYYNDFNKHKNEKDTIHLNSARTNGPGLADLYLSPSHMSRNELHATSGISPPHSVVYQNEEGKWVTDLAYYTSFDNEQDFDDAGAVNENFITGSDAIEMIAEDEREFEKEHRFIQEEKMDIQNTSLAQGDTSWKISASSHLLRASQFNSDEEDASYLRLSLGEFFGQRSEALGCLGGGLDVKRPSFGYHITSPEKQEPIVLLRTLDTSRSCPDNDTVQFDNVLFPEDLGLLKQEQTGSISFDSGKKGTPLKMEAFNTKEADNSKKKTEHCFDVRKSDEIKHIQGTESMLSLSTIASAIADASVSTDPSQLAAMIMALSNKNRKKMLESGHEIDSTLMNQILSSSLEKNQAIKSFDMERYLRQTNFINQETEHESFRINEDSVQDFTWDLSSLQKQTMPYPITVGMLNCTYIKTPDHNLLLNSKKKVCENEIPQLQQFHSAVEDNKTSNGIEAVKSISNDKETENTISCIATNMTDNKKEPDAVSPGSDKNLSQLNRSMQPLQRISDSKSAVSMKEFDLTTSNRTHQRSSDSTYEENMKECVKDATSQIILSSLKQSNKNRSSWGSNKLKLSCASKECVNLPLVKDSSSHSSSDIGSRNLSFIECRPSSDGNLCSRKSNTISFNSGPFSKHLPVSSKKEDEDLVNFEKHKCETSSSFNAKHVSFEMQSRASSSPENIAQSEYFSGHVNCLDEQSSFRPSTSPLIHSSPSQVTGMAATLGVSGNCVSSPSPLQTPACKDNLSSQSLCSSPGISRLTYISATDSTLHDNTIMPSPEKQCNKTIELSTTIVRASPTPSEDDTAKYSDENFVWQTFGHTSQNNSRKSSQTGCESKNPSKKNNGDIFHKLSKEPLPKRGNQPETNSDSMFKEKTGNVNPVLPRKSSLSHQALSDNVDTPLLWQEFPGKAPESGLSPLNILSSNSGLGISAPLKENISVDQYVPISSFKSFNLMSDIQTVSSSVPTLLTGRSLSATPFAQQYLGTVPSRGTVSLPPYQISSSGVHCLPPGFPTSIQTRHIQNSVTVGIPVGSSVQSGLLGTSAVCNTHPYSVNQNVLNTEKSYTGLQHWGARMASDFVGSILVPEEFKFPNACCVGIASQASLSMYNPTERWLQVNIGILSVAVNGEKMDTLTYPNLMLKNKTIVGPHAAEETQILFLPHCSGIFQFVLTVSSWPVSADAETIIRSEALAVRVVLTAVAENPSIEIDTGKTDDLDFGDLTSGSWKALPLKLTNKTHATVPIRLIISANAAAWHCFMFSKEPIRTPADHMLKADFISQLAAPSVINHVMHASYDGKDPEVLVIWVLFHGPQRDLAAADSLGPTEEFLARIDVEVDSPGPYNLIKSVLLKARTGTARIHAPKDLQTIHLCAKVGFSAKQLLPLKNAGNIAVQLKLQSSDQSNCFSVVPEDLILVPGEEQEIEVLFLPQDSKSCKESVLKIFVQPSGPQYEVVLKGEVEIPGSIKSLAPPSSLSTEVPPILSNKQFIAWGGVTLGRAVQQKLVLRNDSPSATQSLRLVIRGQDQDCFQLQNTFGPEERLTSNRELVIRPKEDMKILLMFTPTRVACMSAKLEIKQLAYRSSQPGIKFTIPLSGYGGTSNIILEDVKKLSDNYVITLHGISSGEVSRVQLSVRNTGSRAAFVKSLCYADIQATTLMDPNVFSIFPEKFVLKERTQVVLKITCRSTRREQTLCTPTTALLATVVFFSGDEISRKQYRRALFHKHESSRKISENSLLRNMKFDEEFQGELLVTEVYDLPQRSNDIQLFCGNLHKVILSVFGSTDSICSNGESYLQSAKCNLESRSGSENSDGHISNMSLDVLPVKGPQGPPLCLNVVDSACKIEQTWTIQPEHLMLTAPSISGSTATRHIKLSNTTSRMLTFELSWPAHCLTITPQHGIIEPESHILILVSPNPSLLTKPSALPWSGQIYIHCDNGQKFVKVQIREEKALDIPASLRLSKQLATLSPRTGTPIVHVAKPLIKIPSTKIEIKNRKLIFPKTASNESSETYLDIENLGNEDVKWHVSSFAPPYVKGVDESGDVYRATYTAFRCSRVSGMLEAHGKQQVAFSFFPRERGDYAQFWDLECHPSAEPHLKHKLRFQLCGEGTREVHGPRRSFTESLVKTEVPVKPRRRSDSETSVLKLGDVTDRDVYALEDVCTFPPTQVGEGSTVKVNLQNSSSNTHMLTFISPGEPFHIKHSKYSLRPHHYINLPVKFKPNSEGRFEGLLVVQTDTCGNFGIRLIGEALTN